MPETFLDFSPTYAIGFDDLTWEAKSFICKGCGRTSQNSNDARNRFCDFCQVFHNDIPIGKRMDWAAARQKEIAAVQPEKPSFTLES